MWGKPPIYIPESFCVEVRNFDAAQAWYRGKLDFRVASPDPDADRRNVQLQFAEEEQALTLVEKTTPRELLSLERNPPPVFFAVKLQKAHEWLKGRGISVGPIESDTGGNRLFRFQDLEGNQLEV